MCIAVAYMAIAAGCSRDAETARAPDTAVRLVHLLDQAIGDPGVLVEDGALRVAGGEVLIDVAVPLLPEAARAMFRGDWVRDALHALPGEGDTEDRCVLHWFKVRGGSLYVELMTNEGLAAGEDAFVVEVFDAADRRNFDDPEYVQDLLRRSDPRRLLPDGASGRHRAGVLNTSPSCEVVLVVLRASLESTERSYLRVRRQSRPEAWARGAPRLSLDQPLARLIAHEGISRESILVGVPSTLTFPVDVPSSDPEFELSVVVMGAKPHDVTLVVEVLAGNARVSYKAPLTANSWRSPAILDLEAVSGRAASVTLSLRSPEGGRVFAALGAPTVRARVPDPPLDLVVVSIDTVRADHTALGGYARETTPNLRALAEESVVFDHAVASAPWTLPSHTTLFSGMLPDRHGVVRGANRIPDEIPLLAEDLRAAGYRTAAYTGGGNVAAEFGFGRGFDRYGERDPAYPPSDWASSAQGVDADERVFAAQSEEERGDLIQELARPDRSPRFVFVHTYVAHEYHATEAALRAIGTSPGLARWYASELGMSGLRDIFHKGEEEKARAATESIYDATVWLADELVGEVVEALRRSGRLDQTVLVVVSDHGEELFERGVLGHGHSAFEELTHVPLLIRVPGSVAARVDDVVSLADIAPTLRDLLGLNVSHHEDGRSLRSLLEGGVLSGRPAMTRGAQRGRVFRSLRGQQMKVHVERTPSGEEIERLYDLRADPGELEDLGVERPEQRAALAGSLRSLTEGLEARAAVSADVELSPELREQLRQLGYLGD